MSHLSAGERELLSQALEDDVPVSAAVLPTADDSEDLLGAWLLRSRSVGERRRLGQFLTPMPIVDVMTEWIARQKPAQVVDAGCGTGRFAIAAAQAMPQARVLAIDSDPLAALLCRANVGRLGLRNVEVRCADFLQGDLPLDGRKTAFLGNPPYVRHHRVPAHLKAWGTRVCRDLGIRFSKLAGLHVYFFLATALRARRGDVGCYITSSEWLDVGYGAGLRQLLRERLGVLSVCVLEESSAAFDDAMTTAAVTCFRTGHRRTRVRFSVVPEFKKAEGPASAKSVPVADLAGRWGVMLRRSPRAKCPSDWARLGDVVAVHRGVATGANGFFVLGAADAKQLGLAPFTRPVITAAKQVLDAGGVVRGEGSKVLLLLPRDLQALPKAQRDAARRHLAKGEEQGVPDRYLCRHRQPWWWLGNPEAPPIVASYMARRAPAFALNPDGLLLVNIAHGLVPRKPMTQAECRALVDALNGAAQTFVGNGRRYQGGLEKFEPREMENLMMPPLGAAND